jgi:hypothetical protein
MPPRTILHATVLCLMAPILTATASAQQVGEPLVLDDPLLRSIQAEVRSSEPPSLAELRDPDSDFYAERGTFTVDGVRVSLIENAARGVGIRGGYAAEASRINDILLTRYRSALDRRYNFAPLMLQSGYVVPPAITRIRNVRQLSGPNFLYLTNGSYEIVRDARLTTLPPSWIDYLTLPIRDVRPPDNLSMESAEERAIWRRSVEDGWEQGVREARMAFSTALATLHRDYHGMLLYHDLARQGAVSVPRVDISSRAWRVTEDGRRAFEGETTIEITVNSQFRRRN